jgi:DNA-binding MarR family transcriptional regulator
VGPSGGEARVRGLHQHRAVMNAIFFGAKRAYHSILRVTRKRLASFGLTAARFDLLFAIIGRDAKADRPVLQSKLRRKLGVTGSTVCRMLQSLEKLNLVRREVDEGDRRQRYVELTNKGLACIRAARAVLLRVGQKLVNRAISFGNRRDPVACFRNMVTLEEYFDAIREDYGDTAARLYLWHPDD